MTKILTAAAIAIALSAAALTATATSADAFPNIFGVKTVSGMDLGSGR